MHFYPLTMTAADPSLGLVIGTFFLGLLGALFWPVTRHAITVAHEGTHAAFASLTGGSVSSVHIGTDGAGVTERKGGSNLIIGLAGYLGPPAFGILAATMLVNGVSPDVVLWVSFALLVVVFFQIRNLFGWMTVLIGGFLLFMIGRYGTPTGRTVFVYAWVWFLLLGGVLSNALTNTAPGWSGDAGNLRERLSFKFLLWQVHPFPAGLWGLLFWLATLAGFLYGAGILVGLVDVVPDGV
jgi:hypothetical protein